MFWLLAKFTLLLLAGIAWMIYSGKKTRQLDCRAEERKRRWEELKKQEVKGDK